ncbi:MAG: branched-chain amino acid ABC transporter permease [Hyphomicrobiaceae bacterium]
MANVWKDPTGTLLDGRAPREVKTGDYKDPRQIWEETRQYKVPTYKVGRLRYYHKWRGHNDKLWHRLRYWPTRRRVLQIRGEYNPKTLAREKTIVDKRPIWWAMGLVGLAMGPLLFPESMQGSLFSAVSTFFIYAAINLCWMLIIGTASIFSMASYAVVGAAAYGTTYAAIQMGLPWYVLPFLGCFIGLVFGLLIAIPATRLDGFYYSLLTLGVVELCRVYVLQSKELGSATGGLYGAPPYAPDTIPEYSRLLLSYYACFILMLLALALYRFVDGKRLGRILRMAPEKREAFAEATGVDYRRARIMVFLISSVALGFIGGFYATHFRGASPNLFTFDTVLLSLSMLVIGGLGRAEGAVIGTLIVVLIDRVLIDLGPLRLVLIGTLMLFVVLFLRGGLFGIKPQFRAWRDKKKSEARSTRAEKGGEMLPEESTEHPNKDEVYFRRFDKNQREYLKTLITPELIEEFKQRPVGQHSEALERLLNYFRRQPQNDKYAVMVVEQFKAYRIVALSGVRGVAPRLVEDKIYPSIEEAYKGVFLRRVQDLLEA